MHAVLAERDSTLSAVRQLLDTAANGQGRALFVLGEAGLGKTTLLEHAVALAGERFAVGVGRADVAEAALPFGLLSQALDPLLGVEALGGTDGAAGDESVATRLYAILRQLRAAAARPLLIALDDGHWADPDSLTLLRLICRRLGNLPIAVVATARTWPPETARAAQEMAGEGLVDLERLGPLSVPAATAMVNDRVGHLARPEDIDAAVASCAGNPLLLEHAVAELAAGQTLPGRIGAQPGSWASRLLLSRFTSVGPSGEAFLRAASVLGRRFRPEVAAAMAGLGPLEAAAAQEALVAAGLVVDAGDGWGQFAHDLIRLAVYDQAAPVRTHLHQAAFWALLERRASAAEAAEHATLARLSDPVALATQAEAGRGALQRGAPGTARRHLEAAINLGGEANPPGVYLDLAGALRALGDNDGSAEVCGRLLERSDLDMATRVAALSELAQAEFRAGRIDDAASRIDDTVHLVETSPSDAAIEVLLDHAHLSVLRLGPRAALPLAVRARQAATRAGRPTRILADVVWAECAYLSGDPSALDVAEAAAKAAKGAVKRTSEVAQWSDPEVLYAELAISAERFDDAEALLGEIVDEAERRCYPMNLFEGQFLLVDLLCRAGRLAEALATSDQVLESAELLPICLPMAMIQRALVLVELGRLDEADEWCQRRDKLAATGRELGRSWTLGNYCRGVLAFRQGRLEAAAGIFGRLETSGRRADLLDPCMFPWAGAAIATYLALGSEAAARRVIEWVAPRAVTLPVRWPKAIVVAGRAALAERAGDVAAAESGFVEALRVHHPQMPLARAETLIDYGLMLIHHDQPAPAREVLAEALTSAESCGAAWHAERARVAWRRAGGRTRATPIGELTPQEKAVADLARAGRTNREIAAQLYLSVNTVETHLSHVYRKLGIRRRWQLIARDDMGAGSDPKV